MVSDYVMIQYNCEGLEIVEDFIGMVVYGMDFYNIQCYVNVEGLVKNEGNVEVRVKEFYFISYRLIVFKKLECFNLFVFICVSVFYIVFGFICMELVFMVLG